MKRVIILFAAVLLASIGWSQTMVVTLNDGTTTKYDMNKVKSIEFTDEDSGNGQESTSLIVGTWQGVHGEGWGMESHADGELPILQINSDGTYLLLHEDDDEIKVEHGQWTMVDNHFYRHITEGKYKGTVWDYSILKLTSETLQMNTLGVTGTYKRVSNSILDKYAEIIANYDIGEVVFDVNGTIAYGYDNCKSDNDTRFSTVNSQGTMFYLIFPPSFKFHEAAFIFPSSKYGHLSDSYFNVGFSDFSNIIFEIYKYPNNWYGEYVSGKAEVVENDGKYISIRFDNYKCSAVVEGETIIFTIVSGIIKFKIK